MSWQKRTSSALWMNDHEDGLNPKSEVAVPLDVHCHDRGTLRLSGRARIIALDTGTRRLATRKGRCAALLRLVDASQPRPSYQYDGCRRRSLRVEGWPNAVLRVGYRSQAKLRRPGYLGYSSRQHRQSLGAAAESRADSQQRIS